MKLLCGLVVATLISLAQAGPLVNVCDNCTYSVFGLGYLPADNCHQFLQCRKYGDFIYFQKFCCPEYTIWDQDKLTCNWGRCSDPPPHNCPNEINEEGECYFLPHPTDPHKFINIYGGYEQYCAPGTIFMLEDCKCAHGGNRTCDMYNDPLLHFPFAFDFNDVNCQKAAGIPFGDPYLNDVDGSVCFDGEDDYLVLGFLNNFFAMNQPDSVTVSFWFNQTGDGFMNDLEGLFGNGDCNQNASFLFLFGGGLRLGGAALTWFGQPGDNITSLWYPYNVWCQVSIRYTEEEVCYFLNGMNKVCKPTVDNNLNTQTGSSFGMAYYGCEPYFYTGCLDDLMIFDRYVSDEEMKNCVFRRDRSPRRTIVPYKCPLPVFPGR